MFKNAYLLTVLTALFLTPGCSNNKTHAIKNSLAHIAQAKEDIIAEREEIASINQKAKNQIQKEASGHTTDILRYEEHIKTLNSIINSIAARNDFRRVIDHATDFQVKCIVDKQMSYNDIQYTEEAYPLEQKSLIEAINQALADESLAPYANNELVFNIYYLEATQTLGYKFLLEKLDQKASKLTAELSVLKTSYFN